MLGPAYVYEFADDEGFYTSLYDALLHVQKEVVLTHMQQVPPRGYDISQPYYLDLLRMANEYPDVQFKRLITIPNDSMALWAESLMEDTADVTNFTIQAIVTEGLVDFPIVNMAVLDKRNVFLANSDRTHRKNAGVWAHSADLGEFYANYHHCLWQLSKPLEEALEKYNQKGN